MQNERLETFVNDHCVTYEDFRAHGLKVATPVAEEYQRLFISSTGDYCNIMKANMAARALNPLVAATMNNLQLREALTDLSAYGFDELRPSAIQDIMTELPTYRGAIASTHSSFWSEIDGAKKFDLDLKKKIKENPDEYDANRTWQNDRIEQSRRVWEWWRVMAPKLPRFFTAARLVALVPLSSASVERVFSQVKMIVDQVGDSVLEETLEARVMERVNNYNL